MQEFTGIRAPLENLQEIYKRIQASPQLGFKFFIESADMHRIRAASTAFLWARQRTTIMTTTSFCLVSDGTAPAGTGAVITDSVLDNTSVGSIRQGRAGVVNACNHCGGRFGMVTYRCWGNKFCKRRCKHAFLRELGLGLDEISYWFSLVRSAMILRFWSMLASSQTASAQR